MKSPHSGPNEEQCRSAIYLLTEQIERYSVFAKRVIRLSASVVCATFLGSYWESPEHRLIISVVLIAGAFWYEVFSSTGLFDPLPVKNTLISIGTRFLKATSPLTILKIFRWFVPRAQREEIDLAIEDVKEDARDLKRAKWHKAFIFIVTFWHSIRIIGAYLLDGLYSIVKKVLPLASFFVKKK